MQNNNIDSARRKALMALAASSSAALSLPSVLFANNDLAGSLPSDSAPSDSRLEEDAPLEKYGIVNRQAVEIVTDFWIDANGEPTTFSVKEQQGKWLFMKFFQNWCPGCHYSGFPTLQKFVAAFEGNPKVTSVAVQTAFEGFEHNSKEAVRELQLRYELPIVMGHEQGTPLSNNLPLSMLNYRTGGTPWLILVAPDGKVVMNDFHASANDLIEFVRDATS